ncbi:MAG: type IV toxin-antitoxin system AbiEi family antitoxin domain-containing protein [Jiangellaceae bacterium]
MSKRNCTLPADVLDLLLRGKGIAHVRDARLAGVDESRLRRLAAAGGLERLARGCYASTSTLEKLDEWQVHKIRARAFAESCAAVYLCEWSAAVTWDLPTMGTPPPRPTVLRPATSGQGSTVTRYGRIRVAHLPIGHRWRSGRVGVASRAWSVADLARFVPLPHALVLADAATRAGDDLGAVLPHFHRWEGVDGARWAADHADGNAESPIETLGRFTCIAFDLPLPVANAWVGENQPVRRVDGLWPYHWAAKEADGAVKYNNRPDASAIVMAQNDREFYLRRLGLDVIRYGWELAAFRREELAARIAALLRDKSGAVRADPMVEARA